MLNLLSRLKSSRAFRWLHGIMRPGSSNAAARREACADPPPEEGRLHTTAVDELEDKGHSHTKGDLEQSEVSQTPTRPDQATQRDDAPEAHPSVSLTALQPQAQTTAARIAEEPHSDNIEAPSLRTQPVEQLRVDEPEAPYMFNPSSVQSKVGLPPAMAAAVHAMPIPIPAPLSITYSAGASVVEVMDEYIDEDLLNDRDAELRNHIRERLRPTQKTRAAKAADSIETKAEVIAGGVVGVLPEGTTALVTQGVKTIAAQPGVQRVISAIETSFSVHTPALMRGLEEVAKIHPVVQAAFLVFKAIYGIEKTRRENDQKVLALFAKMQDLMEMLYRLKDLDKMHHAETVAIPEDWEPPQGETLTLRACIYYIRADLQACYNVCDTFSKKRLLTKIVQCISWNNQLSSFVDVFDERKKELDGVLQLLNVKEVVVMSKSVAAMRDILNDIKVSITSNMLLTRREVALLQAVRSRSRNKDTLSNDDLDDLAGLAGDTLGGDRSSTEFPQPYLLQPGRREAVRVERGRMREEVRLDVQTAIRNNLEGFTSGLNIRLDRLRLQFQADLERQGTRIITAINHEISRGAHQKITDQDLQALWLESGWRGAVQAPYLIVALKELYADRVRTRDATITAEDAWALDYIDLRYAQPISEALDEDASGFVTAMEMDRFVSAPSKPKTWNLPVWIAYWAAGWKQLQILYAHVIEDTVNKMDALSSRVHPDNWSNMRYYLYQTRFVCRALTGALAKENAAEGDIPPMFTQYAIKEEVRLENILKDMQYKLNSKDSLTLVLGSDCIEKGGLLLIRILLRRHCDIIRAAQHLIIDPEELYDAATSMRCIEEVFHERAEQISHGWTHQNLELPARFRTFASGLLVYAHTPEKFQTAAYTRTYPRTEVSYDSLDASEQGQDIVQRAKEVLRYEYRRPPTTNASLQPEDTSLIQHISPEISQRYPFLGEWIGRDTGPDASSPSSLRSMHIWLESEDNGDSGKLAGVSWSSRGRAVISGSFVESDGHTDLNLTFDFGKDIRGSYRALRSFLLPDIFATDAYTLSFSGQHRRGEAHYIYGEWVSKHLNPDSDSVTTLSDFDSDSDSDSSAKVGTDGGSVLSHALSNKALQLMFWRPDRPESTETAELPDQKDQERRIVPYLYRIAYSSITEEQLDILRICISHLSPDDGLRCFARLKEASMWTRSQPFVCNTCRTSIRGGRLFCTDCRIADDAPANSFDLCDKEECISRSSGRQATGATTVHDSSHRLVLLRRVVNTLYYQDLVQGIQGWAQDWYSRTTEAIKAQIAGETRYPYNQRQCSICGGSLGFPYWLCLSTSCSGSDAYICDLCVHSAPCAYPRPLDEDGNVLRSDFPFERLLDDIHPIDHHLLRCTPDMIRDSERRPEATGDADPKQRLEDEHAQLLKEHKELMREHKELMNKHTRLLDVIEHLSPDHQSIAQSNGEGPPQA